MDLGLAGQVVAVFGAGRGIGEAIARAFMAEAANVATIDRDSSVHGRGRAVAACASSTGRRTSLGHDDHLSLGLVADVTDYTAVRRAAEAVRTYFGRCDHVVFAVGVGSGKFGFPFWNLEPADWEPVFAGQPHRRGERGPRVCPHAGGGRSRHACCSSHRSPARLVPRATHLIVPPRPD